MEVVLQEKQVTKVLEYRELIYLRNRGNMLYEEERNKARGWSKNLSSNDKIISLFSHSSCY